MKRYFLKRQVLVLLFSFMTLNLFPQTFTEQTDIVLPGLSNGSVSWGDYDNDGDLDILLSGGGSDSYAILKVFRNNGNNTFTDLGSVFTPANPAAYISYGDDYKSSWVDFDNDALIDIVLNGKNSEGGYELNIYRNEGNGTFTRKYRIVYTTFQGGSSFDCGDYDNDGDPDILVVNSIATKVLKNQGNFVFIEQFSIALLGATYNSSRWIDYDLDGDMDILLTGNSDRALYQNQGNNSFIRQTGISFSGGNGGTNDWGDYNNDGFPDLLLTGGVSYVYKNNGNNTFTLQTGISLSATSKATGNWGDFDNDGDLDILITGNNNTTDITKIYINNGNNTFTEATGVSLDGISEGSVDLGDYDNDGDGDLDIIISGKKGPEKICKVYKNNSSVTNPVPSAPTGLTSVSSGNDIILKWNRVTSDNTPAKALSYNILAGTVTNGIDLVNPTATVSGFRKIASIGNSQFDTAFVLRGIKKGTYKWKVQAIDNSFKGGAFSSEATFTYSASFQAYALSVKNTGGKEVSLSWSRGNGDNCIVFVKTGTSGTASPVNNTTYTASTVFGSPGSQIGSTGWYCVYKGSSNSVNVTGLTPLTDYIIQVQEFSGGPTTETYNNIVSGQNSITLKTGIFTELVNTPLATVNFPSMNFVQSYDMFWFDFDNDNDLDLFIMGPKGQFLYKNNGNDVFAKVAITFGSGQYADCGDFNNDGNVDIAFISSSGTTIYANNGNSTFTQVPGTSFEAASYGSIDWGDYDNDGDLDLIIVGEAGSFACITKIYRNNGNSTFTEMTNHNLPGVRYGCTDWGDFNNDGYLDLVLSGINLEGSNVTSIFRNDKQGGFIKQSDFVNALGTVKWGDYDNDGDLDVLSISGSQNKIFRNEGNNTFTRQDQISLGSSQYGNGSWGDYNNDGYLDILISGYKDMYIPFTTVYKNNGNNTFQEDVNCKLTPAGYSTSSWGDYDNDGDLDILLTGISADSAFSKIYRNDINIANQVPAAPSGVVSAVTKSDVELKWKSVRTDNTNYLGLAYNLKVGTTSGAINIISPHSSTTGYRKVADMGNANLDTTFYLKNLPLGTYFWRVQAVDNSFKGGPFSTENSFSIVPVQATDLTAKIITDNSLLLKWERGNGYRSIVFCKEGSTGFSVPVNNKSYLQDSEFGFGEQLGTTGWYCVYNGRNDSIIVTGLKYKTDYSFHVIEYLGNPGVEQYFTGLVNGNPGVFSTGLFSEQTSITLSASDFNIYAWGDYNNDGFSDILIPGNLTKLYKNNGDNSFSTVTQAVFSNGRYGSANWGDYDNNGDLDVLLSGATGDYPTYLPAFSEIYRNDGSGLFSEQTQITIQAVYYSSADWGDYDNDGDLDFILTGATGNDPYYNPITKIYMNNGNGSFTAQDQIVLPGVFRGDVKWIDYDNDGDLDIHLSGSLDYQYSQNCISKIYRNDGNNTFTLDAGVQFEGLWEASADWADYDNDGDLDVVMTKPGRLYAYKNQGGSFAQILNKGYGYSSFGCVSWGDYDNDGFMDILFSNFAAAAIIFKNNNGQNFSEVNDGSFVFTQVEGLEWCDYDNDGDIDILVNQWGEVCKLYKNNLFMTSGLFKPNNPADAPVGLTSRRSPTGITLNWKPVKTDETKYSTLSYNVKIGKTLNGENVCASHSLTTGFRKITGLGNAQLDTTFLIKNMESGKYYWKVQAVDQGFKGGAWSVVDSFEVKNILAFFSADEVCKGLSTTFTNQSTAYGDVIQNYLWNFGDGTNSNLQNPTHIFSSSGIHNVTLIASSATNSDTLTKQVLVKAKPPVDFSATTACQGIETTLVNLTDASGLNITSWSWDYGDGKGSTFQNPGSHGYLSAGDYQLTLTANADNGCSGTIVKTVTVGAYPVATITANTPLSFCSGDSVTLSVGSNPDYSYEWMLNNTGITNAITNNYTAKISGNYSVEVTNSKGSCKTSSSQVSVTKLAMPATPVIITENYQAGKCPGENPVALRVDQPVTEYSYQWKRNGTPISNATTSSYQGFLPAGDYTVVVSQAGCKSESGVKTIFYDDAPVKPIIYAQGPTVWYLACSNDTASQYKWYYNGTLIPGADKYLYVANQKLGKYNVSISNAKGCFTMSDTLTIPTRLTGIEDIDPFKGLMIYPNPTTGIFTIEMDNQVFGELMISILDQGGKEILNIKFEKTTEHFSSQIDLSGQAKGMYLIKMLIDKYSAIRKLIVE